MVQQAKSKIETPNIKKLDNGQALPIKDVELIEKIKSMYKENEDYRGLLAFLISINTGLKISDLLNLDIKDVKQCVEYQ